MFWDRAKSYLNIKMLGIISITIIAGILVGTYTFYLTYNPITSTREVLRQTMQMPNFLNPKNTIVSAGAKPVENKYLDGSMSEIVFFSRENYASNKLIPRKGTLVKRPSAKATILVCHGFMCDRHDIGFLRTIFEPYNIMTFDFRAHGELTENQCCSLGKNEALDVLGAVEYIKSQPDLKDIPLFVYGFSMGAVSSILAQSMSEAEGKSLFVGAIWDCPFESTEKLLERNIGKLTLSIFGYEFPLPGRSILHRFAFHPYVQALFKASLKAIAKVDASQVNTCIAKVIPEQAIKNVTIPTLFIACVNDDKAPVAAVTSVFKGACGFKRLWVTKGRRHFDSLFYNPEKYTHKVRAFIEKVLDNQITTKKNEKIIRDN